MSVPENKKIAERFMQVWGNGSLDIIDELAAPSLVVLYPIFPRVIQSPAAFKQLMTMFRAAFPDAALKIEEVIGEGDKVVIRWNFSGTHSGNLMKIPPTGKKVAWTGITIYTIINGKVTAEKGEEDFLGFLRQIGIVPGL